MFSKRFKANWLMRELEMLDSSLYAVENSIYRRLGNPTKRRAKIRKKLIALGPEILPVVLKRSRHEGWDYRDDVYEIMNGLAEDPADFFIESLNNPDIEIQCSAVKWLRDKCRGQQKMVVPLLEYLKRNPNDQDVFIALDWNGVDVEEEMIDIILDTNRPWYTRFEACNFLGERLGETNRKRLLDYTKSVQHNEDDESIRQSVLVLAGVFKNESRKPLISNFADSRHYTDYMGDFAPKKMIIHAYYRTKDEGGRSAPLIKHNGMLPVQTRINGSGWDGRILMNETPYMTIEPGKSYENLPVRFMLPGVIELEGIEAGDNVEILEGSRVIAVGQIIRIENG